MPGSDTTYLYDIQRCRMSCALSVCPGACAVSAGAGRRGADARERTGDAHAEKFPLFTVKCMSLLPR